MHKQLVAATLSLAAASVTQAAPLTLACAGTVGHYAEFGQAVRSVSLDTVIEIDQDKRTIRFELPQLGPLQAELKKVETGSYVGVARFAPRPLAKGMVTGVIVDINRMNGKARSTLLLDDERMFSGFDGTCAPAKPLF